MIKIEVCGNTTKEAVNELIELAELIKGNVKFSKPLVTTREDVVKEDNMSNLTPTPVVKEVEEHKEVEVNPSETPWEAKEISIDEVKEAYIKALHKQDTDEKKTNFKNKAKEFLTLHEVTNVSKLNLEDRAEFLKLLNEIA